MEANTGKFPRKSVGAIIAIVALLVSASAVCLDYDHTRDASEELQTQKNINEEQNRQLEELVETQKQQNRQLEELVETQKQQNRQLEELVETQKQHYEELKKEFEEVIQPHTRHEEIFDYISLLYNRIVLYGDWLNSRPSYERVKAWPYWEEACRDFQNAEKELRAGNFIQAELSVQSAYDNLVEGRIAATNTTTSE